MAIVKNDRDVLLQGASVRLLDAATTIGMSTGAFNTEKNGGPTTPSSITLTASVVGFTPAAVKTWYWANNVAPNTWTSAGTGNSITITNTAFLANVGAGTSIQYKVVVTEFGYLDAVAYNTISYIKQADDPMSISLIIPADFPSATNLGVVSTLPSGNAIRLYQGPTLLTSGVTYGGTSTKNGLTLSVNASTGALTLTQSTWTSDTEHFAVTATYNSIVYTVTYTISKNKAGGGTDGAPGDKYITITAFKWSNSGAGTYIQPCTFTWSTGTVNAYPAGWSASAPASPGTGYTLYLINLQLSAAGNAATTASNWSNGVISTIGYRFDGVNGDKYITITAFKWSNSGAGGHSQACTYTWSTGVVSNYPSGWSASASAAPGNGYTLYQLNLQISAPGTATTSNSDWNGGIVSSVGYRFDGANGNGIPGDRHVTLHAFKWSNSGAGPYWGAMSLTWSTMAVSAYPGGWTPSASASPGTGYTLYQLSLLVKGVGTETISYADWSSATVSSIGYRQDGSIGPQGPQGLQGSQGLPGLTGGTGNPGDSYKAAYALYNNGGYSFSGSTSTYGATSVPGSTWSTGQLTSFTQNVQTPANDQALYQCDGVYSVATNTILWQAPYLSNFKVGSLSAISANMGYITAGDIKVGSNPEVSGLGMTGYGTHLYGNGRFVLGTPSRNIGYNGSDLFLNGVARKSGVYYVSGGGALGGAWNAGQTIWATSWTSRSSRVAVAVAAQFIVQTLSSSSIYKRLVLSAYPTVTGTGVTISGGSDIQTELVLSPQDANTHTIIMTLIGDIIGPEGGFTATFGVQFGVMCYDFHAQTTHPGLSYAGCAARCTFQDNIA